MKNKLKLILVLLAVFQIVYLAQTASLKKTLELKNVSGVMVPYQNGIPLPSFEKQKRKISDLSGAWKKERMALDTDISLSERDSIGYKNLIAESDGRYLKDYDDSSWEVKTIPSVENEMYDFPKVPEYYSEGVWYRRSFQVEELDSAKLAKLVFLSVNYIADVWINGEYVGYHEGGYTPFAFDVSSKLIIGEVNVIAVRIDIVGWNTRKDIIPYNGVDWFNYGGIIHDVYLEYSNPQSIVRSDIIPLDIDGRLKLKSVIWNSTDSNVNLDVNLNIYKAAIDSNNIESEFSFELIGSEVAVTGEVHNSINILADSVFVWNTNLKIDNPDLWSPEVPNLYIAKVSIFNGENIVDEFYSQFGIRTVTTEGNKFLLNKRIRFLPGIARHEDHPIYGRSLPKKIIFDDLNMIKKLNVNFLRTAHYPNHPYTYLVLDRLGITAMQEIPLWQVDEEEPWLIQNNDRKLHLQMFREMVFKDYNRPSIIFWSTSNECHEETNRLVYNNMVVEDITNQYDDKRLITQSAAADNPGATDITQQPLDVAGWTMYFGIFYDKGYTGPTFSFINEAKLAFPDKPILDTEFGFWSSENNSTLQKQVDIFEQTFSAFKFQAILNKDGSLNPNGSLMACTWWCIFDWYSSFHPFGFQSMGLYSMDRQTMKPVAQNLKVSYLPYFNSDGILTTNENNSLNIPNKFELKQNYPNPFNPSTTIKYSVPQLEKSFRLAPIQLKVFDILGKEIKTLVNEVKQPGVYETTFDGDNLSSGMYFYELRIGTFRLAKKMLLVK